jgi:tetratricopeptide (TPR) repeat protein
MSEPEVSITDFLQPMQIMQHAKEIQKCLDEGRILQGVLEVPQEKMEAVFRFAVDFFEDRAYTHGSNIFAYLLVLNAYDPRLWKGLAVCRSCSGDHLLGVECLALAHLLHPKEGAIFTLAALFYQKQGAVNEALAALERAKELGASIDELTSLIQQGNVEKLNASIMQTLQEQMSSVRTEPADPRLQGEETQKKVAAQILERLNREIAAHPKPEHMCSFYKRFMLEQEGNMVSFALSFLSELADGSQGSFGAPPDYRS